jgi:Na+/proline symporter
LSALLTRDVYARLLVRDRDDHHYLRVGQWLTPLIIAVSFLYVPFLLRGSMLLFYLEITSTFVIPLLTIFLMGALTRVHRSSGLIGLVVGALYGIIRLFAFAIAENHGVAILPAIMTNTYAAYPISMLLTAGTMGVVSLFMGWEAGAGTTHCAYAEEGGWLRSSQLAVRDLDRAARAGHREESRLPSVLAIGVVVTGCLLSFVIFW